MRSTALRLLLLSAPLLPVAAASLQAQQSHAMSVDCRGASADTPENRQRAERWVQERLKAFVPSPDQALRTQSLTRQAEQVKLAFHGISSTCAQYLAGTIEREVADRSLHGFEQTIANFIHDTGNDATVLAARGQVADMGAIRQVLTDIGATGRQAALLGDEQLAEVARKTLVDAPTGRALCAVGSALRTATPAHHLPGALRDPARGDQRGHSMEQPLGECLAHPGDAPGRARAPQQRDLECVPRPGAPGLAG